jgi:hypothetical protein
MKSSTTSTDAVLAPLYIGFHNRRPDLKNVSYAVHIAETSVPSTRVHRKTQLNGRSTKDAVLHVRDLKAIAVPPGTAASWAVRCYDAVPNRTDLPQQTSWRIAIQRCDAEDCQPALPEGLVHLRLSVTDFYVTGGVISALQQLALFRSLFVTALRNVDTDLVVVGGQSTWNPSWWNLGPGAVRQPNTADTSAPRHAVQTGRVATHVEPEDVLPETHQSANAQTTTTPDRPNSDKDMTCRRIGCQQRGQSLGDVERCPSCDHPAVLRSSFQ